MSPQKLVLTSFQKALASLEEAIHLEKTDIVRDATIQRFEYTYELAWKLIKRHLDWLGDISSDALTNKRELFREAARAGLIGDAERWFDYHRARNETSHTYNQVKAEEVYDLAVRFAPEARALLEELSRVHD